MFSLPFLHTSLDFDNTELIQSINSSSSEFTWVNTSKVRTSFGSDWTNPNLLDAIRPHVQTYMQNYMRIVGPAKIQIWFNEYEFTFFQEEHTHSEIDALISGVYYVSMPDNSTPTVFSSNYKDLMQYSGYKQELSEFSPSVKEGDLVLFPPFVKHFVQQQPIKQGEKRITVAFNVLRSTV